MYFYVDLLIKFTHCEKATKFERTACCFFIFFVSLRISELFSNGHVFFLVNLLYSRCIISEIHKKICKWMYWWNTVVLGRMYRSILSSCWGIEAQYWLTSGAKRRRRPVLPLNSEAWWQYWPIHPTQNYCILIVSISTFVPNIGFFFPF